MTYLNFLNIDGLNNSSLEGDMLDQITPRSFSRGNSSENEIGLFTSSKANKNSCNFSRLNASIHKIMGLVE